MDTIVVLAHSISTDPAAFSALGQAADELGYYGVSVSEHIVLPVEYGSNYPFSDNGRPPFDDLTDYADALTALGFMAGITSRIRLMTSVIPILAHHPLHLAKQIATVDLLSGGRAEVGLGCGWLREEGEILGHGTNAAGRRLHEAIAIMRTAWSAQETFSHAGEFWQFPEIRQNPKPPQGENLPIWIGGSGPSAVRTTVEYGVGNLVVGDLTKVRETAARLRAERPDIRIAARIRLNRGDPAATRESALAVQAAGVDTLQIVFDHLGPPSQEFVDDCLLNLEWFAREIRDTI